MSRPIEKRAQPGYYPGYSTLALQDFWDEATRDLVLKRVYEVPPLRFFSPYEQPTARALFDRLVPQDDRDEAHCIPILHYVDARLYERRLDGYRYEDMPDAPWAHRLGLRGVEAIARHLHGRAFYELDTAAQEDILLGIRDGKPAAGHFVWDQMNVKQYWNLVLQDALSAYYAHPWAWDEIGFGGPAYPRGYMRLEKGMREPWEVDERRHDWEPPPGTRSHELSAAHHDVSGGYPGQGGTH